MIRVVSIFPSKNDVNVPVNTDVKIMVEADFKLDPRNISFKLNDIDIVPNVFSVYQGSSVYELDVTLYTRRRIKFGDNHRYGEDDLRYGMRDIHPSVLEYGARYVCSFTVWGENDNGEEETLTDSFVFTTEQGVFYNEKPKEYFYSDFTQSMANKLPSWAKGRYDKYSNFQQFLNPLGEVLEKNQDMLDKVYQTSAIQTVDLKELPYLYKYELDKNFEFETFFNQDGSTFFVQPDLTGIQGITLFDLFTTEDNTLKSLYYEKTPTRINNKQTVVFSNEIWPLTKAKPLEDKIEKELEREGGFALYCTGVETSVHRDRDEGYSFVKAVIKGTSIYDQEQQEEFILYNEDYMLSRKMWRRIDSIEFYNLKEQNVEYKIVHFPDPGKRILDSKKIINMNEDVDFSIWSLDNRGGNSILQKRKTLGDTGVDVLRFAGETEVVQESSLLDIDGTSLSLIDIAVDHNSNRVYGLCDECLYIFDKREPYPERLKEIPGDNGNADFSIILQTDELYLDENNEKEIILNYIHATPGKKVIKYRVSVQKPDGQVLYLLEDGQLETDKTKATIRANQVTFTLDKIVNRYKATEPGEYIFLLETVYEGGESSKDYAFAYIQTRPAIARYKLERILNGAIPTHLFIDYDQELKIYTDTKALHTVVFHKDGVVIDYENKIVYSSEEYTALNVE